MTENSLIVKKMDYLLIDYIAKFENGTMFDTTSNFKSISKGALDIAFRGTTKADV